MPAKPCAVGPKMKKVLKNFQIFEIFWSKSLWKIEFFHRFLLTISWSSASSPKVSIYLWKITQDFYNNFSDFLGGGTFRTNLYWHYVLCHSIVKASKSILWVGYSKTQPQQKGHTFFLNRTAVLHSLSYFFKRSYLAFRRSLTTSLPHSRYELRPFEKVR